MRSDPDLEDFLRTRAPEMSRVAVLVDGDAARARRTVDAVLVEAARRWRELSDEGRPSARTWAGLADRLLALPDPSPTDPDATDPSATDPSATDPDATDPDALSAAWAALPRATRLTWVAAHDDPPGLAEGLASVGRMPPTPLPEQLASARTALTAALARQHADEGLAPPSEWETERAATALLDDLAAPALAWGDPVADVTAIRRRRRRRVGLAVAGLAGVVTVAVLAGSLLIPRTAQKADQAGATGSPRATFSLPATSTDRSAWAGWPARGGMASDGTLRSGVLRRYGSDMRILWAADVADRRQVLLAPRSIPRDDHPELTFLNGPAFTAVADLVESKRWANSATPVIAIFDRTAPDHTRLIVLAPPDLPSAEVSRTVQVGADFSLGREWERLPLTEGGGVITLAPSLWTPMLVRAGPVTTPPALMDPEAWANERFDCSDCSWGDAQGRMIETQRADMAAAMATSPDQIRPEVVLDADLGSAPVQFWGDTPEKARALIVRWTLPSGAVLQSVLLAGHMTNPPTVKWAPWMDAQPVLPGRETAPTLLHLTGRSEGATLLALVPTGSPVAAVGISAGVTAGAPEVAPTPVVDGVAILDKVPDRDGATVTTYAADGSALQTQDLWEPPVWNGPWDLYRNAN